MTILQYIWIYFFVTAYGSPSPDMGHHRLHRALPQHPHGWIEHLPALHYDTIVEAVMNHCSTS